MNILLIMDNTIENILYLDPFIESLKEKYKDPQIYALCNSESAHYVQNWKDVTNIIKYEKNAGIFEKYTLYSRFKNISFSLTFDFNTMSSFFLRFFLKSELYYKLGSNDKKEENQYKKYENMLSNIDLEMYHQKPVWYFPEGFSYKVGKVKAPLLTVLPFDKKTDNKKNISFYLYVISEFYKKYRSSIIILGDKKFSKLSQAFDVYDYVFNNVGKTDLNQDAFVLKYSSVIIGSDLDRLLLSESLNQNIVSVIEKNSFDEKQVLQRVYNISDDFCD